MSQPMNTGLWGKLLWPGVNKWYGDSYNDFDTEYDKIFAIESSDRAYEEDVSVSSFGLAVQKDEGQPVEYDSEQQGFLDRYTHVTYSLGFIITKELVEDDLYSKAGKRKASSLARSMRQTKEMVLKARFPQLQVFAVEPAASPVISGGQPGPHPLQGIGAGFVPKNLHVELLDGVIQVDKDEAFAYAARCAREEGILVGISSGASLAAVAKKLPELPAGARVLTFCYDTGERYLSVEGLLP